MTDRDKHIEECKKRALRELDENGIKSALTQLGEEFQDHEEIAGLHYLAEMFCQSGAEHCTDIEEARAFINDFHRFEYNCRLAIED